MATLIGRETVWPLSWCPSSTVVDAAALSINTLVWNKYEDDLGPEQSER